MILKALVTFLLVLNFVSASASTPVRTAGVGPTYNDALHDAFRRAIEYQIGTVLVSNFEVSNSKAVRNEILAYSAGYVINHKVVSQENFVNKIQLVVDVWVASSKIADRILSSNHANQNINGGQLAGQMSSWIDTQQRADKLVNTILDGWPSRAYTVNQTRVDWMIDDGRRPYFNITYSLTFNPRWVEAFKETAVLTSTVPGRPTGVLQFLDKPNSILESGRWNNYYFSDGVLFGNIRKTIETTSPLIRVQLLSGAEVVQSGCFLVATHLFYNTAMPHAGESAVKLFTARSTTNEIQFYVDSNSNKYRFTEIKLDIVKRSAC